MGRNSFRRGGSGQTASLRFQPELLETVHVLGGSRRWNISNDRKPWNGSIDRATTACRAGTETIGHGTAFERSSDSVPVCTFPDRGRDAVGVLSRAVGDIWEAGPDLSNIHCDENSARHFRAADRGHSGGSDVESERRAEFVVLERDHGLLFAPAAPGG